MTEPQRRQAVETDVKKLNPHMIAVGLLGALIAAALIFIFAGGGSSKQDRLGDDQASAPVDIDDPEARCANSANYDLIKQEVFRRASQASEADREAFDQLAKYAVLRAETPILRGYDQRTNAASCSAYVSIDLPPGVAIPGGRRTLAAEVGYLIQNGRLTVTEGDALIAPLSKVARIEAPADPALDEIAPEGGIPTGQRPDVGQPESATQEVGPATVYPGRPSFNCGDASTRGEIAVCQNSSLAALDVNMAAQFRRAIASANPQQRAILNQTRERFLGFRDNCPTVGCMRDAYIGRMQEIRDIMEGRWRPR